MLCILRLLLPLLCFVNVLYCLNLLLVSNVHHDMNFLIKSAGASPIFSESESVLLGFGLISVSMSSTGARPNINSNGVNLVEPLLLVR